MTAVEIGQRFGLLTVIAQSQRPLRWSVKCDCGSAERDVIVYHLLSGHSASCGCAKLASVTRHGKHMTPTYRTWNMMIQRCTNKKNGQYGNYGARGISVCERWRDFTSFLADMGEKPSGKTSIDRINNDGNYEPNNCRWATASEQNNNMRRNRRLTYQGKTQTVTAWATELGLSPITLSARLRLGWSIGRAITTPKNDPSAATRLGWQSRRASLKESK